MAGAPGVVYQLKLSIEGVPFEIRGSRISATAVAPGPHAFALYRCDQNPCQQLARLAGEVGRISTGASTAIPLSALGIEPSEIIQGLRALTGIGEGATGMATVTDQAALPDATLPVAGVAFALTPAGDSRMRKPSPAPL